MNEIVRAVTAVAPSFGGINLEDISAPRCFEVEKRLRGALDTPVIHDDEHGTATVVLAAMLDALESVDKQLETAHIVIVGAGAAGTAVTRLLLAAGANPRPEVDADEIADLAAVSAPGSSDHPNQVNNALAFPGLFQGLLGSSTAQLDEHVFLAAAQGLASLAKPASVTQLLADALDPRVAPPSPSPSR